MRNEPQETAVIQIRIAMITFALFMIREIYCKLNSISGNPLSRKRISDRIYSKSGEKFVLPLEEATLVKDILKEQQQCRSKAEKKLPSWIKNRCLFASVPLEQCTSETIAKAKAGLFAGETMLSLTGGLGVDDAAFSKSFNRITSLDSDPGLNAIARFNNHCMGIENVERLDTTAELYLSESQAHWDCIYADPDRRAAGNRATTNVSAYAPDIVSIFQTFEKMASRWIVKLSPMTDLRWFETQMGIPVRFYIFCTKGEIKELLAVWDDETKSENCIVNCHDDRFEIFWPKEPIDVQTTDTDIFCELSAAAIKAGFRDSIMQQSGLQPASSHGFYLTGKTTIPAALGRCFLLKHRIEGSLGEIAQQLGTLGIGQANVSARDFVLPAEETRKKLKLRDGGACYLFFTGKDKIKTCFVTEKPA